MVQLLKAYEEYKYIDTLWLKKIPITWKQKKAREIFIERRTKVSDKDYAPLSVSKAGIVPQLDTAVKTDNGDNRRLVKVGDFVINSRSDRKGSSGISPYEGSVSLICIVLKPITGENPAYLHYLLRSVSFTEEFYKNGKGLVSDLWTTKWNELKNIFLPIPPREEQDKIVCYLNWKISEMNHFVNQKKKQIKLLDELKKAIICKYALVGIYDNRDMQMSEYPWIDKFPAGWKETRAKNVLKKLNHSVREQDKLLICSNSGKVFFRGDSKLGLVADSEDIYQGVRKGDLLIHGMDTWHGAIAISEYDGKCTPVVHVCNSSENKEYVAYYLRALAFLKVYKKISNGVRENTSDFRSWFKAGNINVLVPPRDEQDKIIEILNGKYKQIENIITALEKEIELVEELKEKIIADVVTGKVDVRNVVVPDYIVEEEILEECDRMENDEEEDD